jgi:hypothetical protein
MAFTDRLHNRGSISTGYDIDNSLKLEDDNTENLYRALNLSTSTTKFTVSMWAKRTEINGPHLLYLRGVAGNESVVLRFATESASYPEALQVDIGAGGTNSRSYTKASFRDASAWYHIVLAVDTTQSTATDRFKLYVNGVLETEYASRNNPAQNFAMEVSGAKHRHGAYNDTDGFAGYCGYIAECHYVDGLQVAQTEFGEFDDDSGIWKPKAYSGSYGTGGYYLDFSDSSALGNNSAGDGTDFTLNNITSADQATDTPTNNFCTLNILQNYDSIIFTEGATSASVTIGGNVKDHAEANMGFSSGKWYMEFYVTNSSASDDAMFGFGRPGLHSGINQNSPGNDTYSFGAHNVSRWYYNNQTWTTTGASGWDKGQVIQIAIDADNGKAWQGVNGTYSSGNPSTNTGGFDWGSLVTDVAVGDLLIPVTRTMYTGPGLTAYNYGGYTALAMNSVVSDENGYGSFEYAPPTGFYALCTKNLAKYGG